MGGEVMEGAVRAGQKGVRGCEAKTQAGIHHGSECRLEGVFEQNQGKCKEECVKSLPSSPHDSHSHSQFPFPCIHLAPFICSFIHVYLASVDS